MKRLTAGSGQEHIARLRAVDCSSLPDDGGPDFNRLIFAASPYLLQHAENPVDWYPWGEEAFNAARAGDKPLFVSIGYATCHWCHVMEEESFADREVAAAINRTCIAVKIDREERPDLDEEFMLAAQFLNGGGGWPLNLLMTAEKVPFFAATYLPKESRDGRLGIIDLMARVDDLWQHQRRQIAENCRALTHALSDFATPQPGPLPGVKLLRSAARQILAQFDPRHGGFGSAPKFPMPVHLLFLLRSHRREADPAFLAAVERTLHALRAGGIYDQLGFGCHRYSVDDQWLVPHFEKMLYDQALLALAALESFQASADDRSLRLAAEIFTYLQRDLAAPGGGFYAAEDADSPAGEGDFYLWTEEELTALLGAEEGAGAARYWGVSRGGNFAGKNILFRPDPEHDSPAAAAWRRQLLAARAKRQRPFRDEKLLTAWNGLAIVALARASSLDVDPSWLQSAKAAAEVIQRLLTDCRGRLLRSFPIGIAPIPALLEDYAFYLWGLIELHQATLEDEYLDAALRLSKEMLRIFRAPGGGLYTSAAARNDLPQRRERSVDGVIPSGQAVAALDLLRLGAISADAALTAAGEEILAAQMGTIAAQPTAHLFSLCALDFLYSPRLEVTLSNGTPEEIAAIRRRLSRHFLPQLLLRRGTSSGPLQIEICNDKSCLPPLGDLQGLEEFLATRRRGD